MSSNITTADSQDASAHRQPAAASSGSSQLASAKVILRENLRHFQDFPIAGIDFVDIMPLFSNPVAHATLLDALTLQIAETFTAAKPDVIVGLDARGFLFGPGLALRLGIPFAPVRKQGKLPGPCVTAEYIKEYGKDLFQMQDDAIKEGQNVLVVDDIIATGKPLFSSFSFSLFPFPSNAKLGDISRIAEKPLSPSRSIWAGRHANTGPQ
jgi:adenine phosphoribosyltransferase